MWEWRTLWKNTIDAKRRRCSRDFHPREDIRLETLLLVRTHKSLSQYQSIYRFELELHRMYKKCRRNISITEDRIRKKLRGLLPSKCPGPDDIHPSLLKELADVLAKPLETIFNTSLQTHRLPAEWKIAHVSAIFKKDDRSSANNYRPISLTGILSN